MPDEELFRSMSTKKHKVGISIFFAGVSKNIEISRWLPSKRSLHSCISWTKVFFGNPHIKNDTFLWKYYFYKKVSCFFGLYTHLKVKWTHFQFCPVADRQSGTQTDKKIYITLHLHLLSNYKNYQRCMIPIGYLASATWLNILYLAIYLMELQCYTSLKTLYMMFIPTGKWVQIICYDIATFFKKFWGFFSIERI